jgi:DNA-directed RNA polymerase specialized sigma24 family protein
VQTRLGRDEQIAALYIHHAAQLRRSISARARGLDPTLVDEACAFAREKLLRRPDIDVTRYDAYRWIYKVALHRAWVLGRAVLREQPSGSLSGADDDRPEPPGHDLDLVDVVADRVECATVREVLGELHWRERRELLLYAHGLSYEQIAKVTGTSYTAVNPWLDRGKKALRQAPRPRSRHRRPPQR